MSYFILCVDVALMVIIWPMNRWVMKHDGRTRSIGLAITFVGMILSALGALITKQPFITPDSLLFGSITGAAYDFGFCMIIFYCLKIGPSGATATINNIGFMFPVLIGIFVFSPDNAPSMLIIIGILCVVMSLILMAFNRTEGDTKAASVKWFKWVSVGGLLSGVALSSQFIATHFAPDRAYSFAFSTNLVAFLILVVVALVKKDTFPKKAERIAGVVTGTINIVSTGMLFYLLRNIPSYVFYPVIMTAPVLIILFIGQYKYKEKMNRFGWAACLTGMLGLVLFNI